MIVSLLFLAPFIGALLAVAVGIFARPLARWIASGALGATAILSVAALQSALAEGVLRVSLGGWPPPIGIEWALDPLGAFVACLVAGTACVVVAGAGRAIREEFREREPLFYSCSLLLVAGLIGMSATADLFNLFVFLELVSLCAYGLVACGERGAPWAAMNYLLVGSLGASLYLLGVGHLYAATGTLNMADVARHLAEAGNPTLAAVACALIAVGLGVKMGLLPLHAWMPEAYRCAPSTAAALMAPLVSKVSAYALIRILYWVYGSGFLANHRSIGVAIAWSGAIALVFGAWRAARENDFRRLLAYSAVSQMGIIAAGIGLANTSSVTGAILHIANDVLMKTALFLAAIMASHRFGVRAISDLSRLRGHARWTSAAIVVAGLSLVGIPPLCGFFGKWYVLAGAIEAGRPFLAAALVVGSLATAVYVFRIIERLFLTDGPLEDGAREGPAGLVAACVAASFTVIALGLGIERVVSLVVRAALPAGV